MSSRVSRPRSRQRLVGVSAVAVGALLTTYAGDFTWQRQTRKKVYVYFFTEDRELRSNRVIIRPRG